MKHMFYLVELLDYYSNPLSRQTSLRRVHTAALSRRRPATRPKQRQVQRRLPRSETADLVAAYVAGAKMNELAEQFLVARSTVRTILVRRNVPIRPRSLSTDDLAEATRLYAAGWSVARIGDKLGFDGTTVWRGLQAMGVSLRRPWERP